MRFPDPLRRLLPFLLLLSACGYDPPVAGDHTSAPYKRALKQCSASAEKAQAQREGTPGAAIAAIFDFRATEHKDVQTCMQTKGYAAQ